MLVSEISTSNNESLLAISLVEENGSFLGSNELSSISGSYASGSSEQFSRSLPSRFHEENDRHSHLTQSQDFYLPFREEKSDGDEELEPPIIEDLELEVPANDATELGVEDQATPKQAKKAGGAVEFHEGCEVAPQNDNTERRDPMEVCIEEPDMNTSSHKLGAVKLAKELQGKGKPSQQQRSIQSCPPPAGLAEGDSVSKVCSSEVAALPCYKEKQEEGDLNMIEVYNIGTSGMKTLSYDEQEGDPIDIYNMRLSGITELPSCELQPSAEDQSAVASSDAVAGDSANDCPSESVQCN